MFKKLYKCSACGLEYKEKELARRCEVWCKANKSCNIEITKQAVNKSINTQVFQSVNRNKYVAPGLAAILGMLGMIFIYVLIVYIATKNISHVIEQFTNFKYWITALILGFGLQMGLFWYIRSGLHLKDGTSKTAIATGAGTGTLSMVACCAHHLTAFLPILGLSAASLFLSKYQTYFFLLGVISNLAGIALMIYIIKTKNCPDFFKFFKYLKRKKWFVE